MKLYEINGMHINLDTIELITAPSRRMSGGGYALVSSFTIRFTSGEYITQEDQYNNLKEEYDKLITACSNPSQANVHYNTMQTELATKAINTVFESTDEQLGANHKPT